MILKLLSETVSHFIIFYFQIKDISVSMVSPHKTTLHVEILSEHN